MLERRRLATAAGAVAVEVKEGCHAIGRVVMSRVCHGSAGESSIVSEVCIRSEGRLAGGCALGRRHDVGEDLVALCSPGKRLIRQQYSPIFGFPVIVAT